jgi:hypothetical protein
VKLRNLNAKQTSNSLEEIYQCIGGEGVQREIEGDIY